MYSFLCFDLLMIINFDVFAYIYFCQFNRIWTRGICWSSYWLWNYRRSVWYYAIITHFLYTHCHLRLCLLLFNSYATNIYPMFNRQQQFIVQSPDMSECTFTQQRPLMHHHLALKILIIDIQDIPDNNKLNLSQSSNMFSTKPQQQYNQTRMDK